MLAEQKRLEMIYAESWTKDVGSLTRSINALCPKWEPVEQTILSNSDMVRYFTAMKPIHYQNLGPLGNELKDHLTAMKSLQGNGLVDATSIKSVRPAIPHGTRTVVYRFVVTCLADDWPKLSSPAEVKAAVEALDVTVENKKVELTKQMIEAVESWRS